MIMLCQSILGLDDKTIVGDYHKSDMLLNGKHQADGSAAASTATTSKTKSKGKLDKSFFSGAPKEAMVSTILFIKKQHGSVLGYLDHIGFDATWRQRFLAVMNESGNNMNDNDRSSSMSSRL